MALTTDLYIEAFGFLIKRGAEQISGGGSGECTLGRVSGAGTLYVGQSRYPLTPGDVILIGEGTKFSVECASGDITMISFPPHTISLGMRELIKPGAPVIRSDAASEAASRLLANAEREIAHPERLVEELLRALTLKGTVEILRSENEYPEVGDTSSSVALALEYISEHPSERLSLPEVASYCKVSTAYLSRKFKSEVGVGFADYVSSYRLDKAAAMLTEHPELSVTEIAFSCGFNDSNYFSDKFKKRFGLPPIKYRKKG